MTPNRHYAPSVGRWTQADPYWHPGNMIYGSNPFQMGHGAYMPDMIAIMASGNLYAYCNNNPILYYDPSGLAPTFYQGSDGKWRFLMDNKGLNATISLFGAVPFLDNAIWWVADKATGNKTVSNNMFQSVATKLGGAAGVGGFIGGASKFAKVAGVVSYVVTGGNFIYELVSDKSYVNQITHQVFGSYYTASNFNYMLANFVAYGAITKDLIDNGIVTYKTSWGNVKDVKVDWDKFDKYFQNLGVTPAEVATYVGLSQW